MKLSYALLVCLVICFSLFATSSSSCMFKRQKKWKRPEFCGNSECPPYKLGEGGENYEERIYEGGKWLVTNISDTKYEFAYTKAVAKLMKYFKGANEDEERIELTTPTLAALTLEKDASGTERDYSFSMWLHPDFQDDAPEPNDEDVEVIEYPEMTVYVRVFGGFATETTILQETTALHEELIKDEVDFDEDTVYVCVYDPVVKLINRHNEVHVVKKGEEPSKHTRGYITAN